MKSRGTEYLKITIEYIIYNVYGRLHICQNMSIKLKNWYFNQKLNRNEETIVQKVHCFLIGTEEEDAVGKISLVLLAQFYF